MAYLVLVRHGESEYNAKGLWTGWTDVSLTDKGRQQARLAAEKLQDIHFDVAYTSSLKRAIETWQEIQTVINQHPPTTENKSLNERNYGDLTGKNKWEVKEQLGDEKFMKIRRSWDCPPPNGESLKMVYERVVPYYEQNILPQLKENKNVIVIAHGNSLRALIKYLEAVADQDIASVEVSFSEPIVYQINHDGKVINKEIRSTGTQVG